MEGGDLRSVDLYHQGTFFHQVTPNCRYVAEFGWKTSSHVSQWMRLMWFMTSIIPSLVIVISDMCHQHGRYTLNTTLTVNPCSVEIICENMTTYLYFRSCICENMTTYLYFRSCIDIEMAQVIKILPHEGQNSFIPCTVAIDILRCTNLGHQQP